MPQERLDLALLLASDESRFINGARAGQQLGTASR
jgi:hypothetical protein